MARLIEPAIARGVARRVAGEEALPSHLLERLGRDLEIAVARSHDLVAEASGIPAPPPAVWMLVDRATWAEANIAGLTTLLAPLADKVAKRLQSVPVAIRLLQRGLVSVEIGVLLGYLSRRVLGQYDLLVAESETAAGWRRGVRRRGTDGAALYFVGTNIIEAERRHQFVPEDFALWVAVHEVTHRFQFAGVPWLKPRFLELVHAYLQSLELDAKDLAARLATAARRLVSGSIPREERNPVYLLATEEQRVLLNDIQALMSVVEGHGNYVMDAIGARVIPSFARMRAAFERRREQMSVLQRAFASAIGLEMKLRQYELGQRFCEAIVSRHGEEALAHLWSDPGSFPTLAELREPELWLERVA